MDVALSEKGTSPGAFAVSAPNVIATVNASTVTIVGAGTTNITASQTGDANYLAATDVVQALAVNKGANAITFAALPAKTFGDATFTLSATASSALAVTYTSSNTAVATISGSTVTIAGAGTTNITASQAGNANFNAATAVVQALTVNKAANAITFAAIPVKTMGDAVFNLTGTASSGLAVAFSTASDKVTLAGNQITIVKPGSVTINANQAGNANVNAAAQVSQTFCINPTKPTITMGGANTETSVLTSSSTTGNQWYLNGTAIAGETNGTLPLKGQGSYTVIVKADNCVSQTSAAQVVIVTGDLTSNDNGEMLIFPNPAKEKLTVQLKGFEPQPVYLMVYDLNGKTIDQMTGQGKGDVTLDVSRYATGKYILRASQQEKVAQKHFVKE